jgi:hypothetical protein
LIPRTFNSPLLVNQKIHELHSFSYSSAMPKKGKGAAAKGKAAAAKPEVARVHVLPCV